MIKKIMRKAIAGAMAFATAATLVFAGSVLVKPVTTKAAEAPVKTLIDPETMEIVIAEATYAADFKKVADASWGSFGNISFTGLNDTWYADDETFIKVSLSALGSTATDGGMTTYADIRTWGDQSSWISVVKAYCGDGDGAYYYAPNSTDDNAYAYIPLNADFITTTETGVELGLGAGSFPATVDKVELVTVVKARVIAEATYAADFKKVADASWGSFGNISFTGLNDTWYADDATFIKVSLSALGSTATDGGMTTYADIRTWGDQSSWISVVKAYCGDGDGAYYYAPNSTDDNAYAYIPLNADFITTTETGVELGLGAGSFPATVDKVELITFNSESDAAGPPILFKVKATNMIVGEKYTVEVQNGPAVSWESSDTKVATVKNGVITAVGQGVAKIVATDENGKTATIKVTVFSVNKMETEGTDEISDMTISGDVKAIPVGTTVSTSSPVKAELDAVKNAMAKATSSAVSKAGKYVAFNVDLTSKDGKAMHQLKDAITIAFPLPQGFNTSYTINVYRLDGDQLTKLPTTVSKGMVSALTDHCSTFVIVQEAKVKTVVVEKTVDVTNSPSFAGDGNGTFFVMDGTVYETGEFFPGWTNQNGVKVDDVVSLTYTVKLTDLENANGCYGTGYEGNGGWGVTTWGAPGKSGVEVNVTPDANGLVKFTVECPFTTENTNYAKVHCATWYGAEIVKIELTYKAEVEVVDTGAGDTTNPGIYVAIIAVIAVMGATFVIRRKVKAEA